MERLPPDIDSAIQDDRYFSELMQDEEVARFTQNLSNVIREQENPQSVIDSINKTTLMYIYINGKGSYISVGISPPDILERHGYLTLDILRSTFERMGDYDLEVPDSARLVLKNIDHSKLDHMISAKTRLLHQRGV